MGAQGFLYIKKKVRRPVKFTAPKIVDDEGNVVG